jgi:hypothetical protein
VSDQLSGRDRYIDSLNQAPAATGPTDAAHGIGGESAPGVPGPDGDVLGNFVPGRTPISNASGDFLAPPNRNEPNLGLQRPTMPDMEFKGGEGLSPADFNRDALTAGHARRSPGDGSSDTAHRAFFEKEAEVGEASLGPGILPTPDTSESYGPIRASDFVRGDIGTANGSGVVRRAPLSADDPMFTGGRERGDNLQADGQPSPMQVNSFPDTAGRTGSGDDASHQVVKPVIDVSPSLGADATGIAKSEFAKKVE